MLLSYQILFLFAGFSNKLLFHFLRERHLLPPHPPLSLFVTSKNISQSAAIRFKAEPPSLFVPSKNINMMQRKLNLHC